MQRSRTDGFTRRRGLASALSLLVLSIASALPGGGRAEPASAGSAPLSRERLERVGDFVRKEIATGTMPGAVILIQQHGRLAPGAKEIARPEVQKQLIQGEMYGQKLQQLLNELNRLAPTDPTAKKIVDDFRAQVNGARR